MDCESNIIEEENVRVKISEEAGIKRDHATVNMKTLFDVLETGNDVDIKNFY